MAEPLQMPGVDPATTSGEPEQKPYFFARPSSPDTNCPICLEEPQNKSYTDTCRHQFCFHCLKEWAKVKPECPLCKQIFRSIIHNIRSAADYDEHRIENQPPPSSVSFENTLLINLAFERRGFRYRTTMGGTAASGRLFIEDVANMFRSALPIQPFPLTSSTHVTVNDSSMYRRDLGTSEFRRQIYCLGLWTRVETTRRRESSPQFYRNNPAQTHRLVPWLNRELNALLHVNQEPHHICQEILSLIEVHPINSRRFADAVRPYFGSRTSHFCYEFYSFATSPFDMLTYDANTTLHTYNSIRNAHSFTNPARTNSESDSDIEVIQVTSGSQTQSSSPRGFLDSLDLQPRRLEAPLHSASGASIPLIEISDSSDSESREDGGILNVEDDSDSSGVEIIASFSANRTPEVITLDSDDDSISVSNVKSKEPDSSTKESPSQCEGEAVASTSRRVSWSDSYQKDSSSDSQVDSYYERRKKRKSRSKKKYSKKKSSKRKRSRSPDSSSSNRKAHKRKVKKEYMISPVKEEFGADKAREEGEERRPRLRSIVRVVSPGRSRPSSEYPDVRSSLSYSTESESELEVPKRKCESPFVSDTDSSDW